MIKIGISACFEYPNPDRAVFGPKTLSYVENDMARYLARKGILPVMIPDVEEEIQHHILDEMDGIVLQGGSDIAPQTYGEEPIGLWKGDPYRDFYEMDILDYAMENEKPVLGICRGFQLMNVYFGGTLFQDTTTQKTEVKEHRSAEQYDSVKHEIFFEKGKVLDRIYANEKHPHVNSVHHQSVKQLGKNLEIYATSDDGLIEAFGYTKAPEGKVMGVQWHPEFTHTLGDELIDADLLYDAFLEHCK